MFTLHEGQHLGYWESSHPRRMTTQRIGTYQPHGMYHVFCAVGGENQRIRDMVQVAGLKLNDGQVIIYASEAVALVLFFATVFSLKPFLNRLDTSLR